MKTHLAYIVRINIWLMLILASVPGHVTAQGGPAAKKSKEVVPKVEVTEGLRVEVGQLMELATGGKIQQYYVWNVSNKTFSKIRASIYLYDKHGNRTGTIQEEATGLKPGFAWAFTINVKEDVSKTRVVKVMGE